MPRPKSEKTLKKAEENKAAVERLRAACLAPEYYSCLDHHLKIYNDKYEKLFNVTLDKNISERRQRELGMKKYIWRSARDARTCPRCMAREGLIFSWDSPPPGGHPGEAPMCRCHAEPVVNYAELDLGNNLQRITNVQVKKKSGCLKKIFYIFVAFLVLGILSSLGSR
jgi:SPP1 gp7 family putative phage head morphogenesis protein